MPAMTARISSSRDQLPHEEEAYSVGHPPQSMLTAGRGLPHRAPNGRHRVQQDEQAHGHVGPSEPQTELGPSIAPSSQIPSSTIHSMTMARPPPHVVADSLGNSGRATNKAHTAARSQGRSAAPASDASATRRSAGDWPGGPSDRIFDWRFVLRFIADEGLGIGGEAHRLAAGLARRCAALPSALDAASPIR